MCRSRSLANVLALLILGLSEAACTGGSKQTPHPSPSPPESTQSAPTALVPMPEPPQELPLESLTGPLPVRFLATTVWDPDNHRVLLYAGYDRTVRSELYSFDPTTNRFELIQSDAPPGRFAHTAVWNPDSSEMIVHGGASESGRGLLSDTWSYRPADQTWRLLSRSGPVRAHSGAVWDPISHRMLLFGGTPGSYQDRDNHLWSFEPSSGEWLRLNSANPPPPRYNHTTTWDPVGNRMLVFGGWTGFPSDPNYNDLWSYSPGDGLWTQLATTPGRQPLGRLRHTAVWNTQKNALWILGGLGGGRLDDLWSYTPASDLWTPESSGHLPKRDRHMAAWDPDLGAMFVFGGGNQTCFFLSDVWRYTDSTSRWSQIIAPKANAGLYAHVAWIDQATDSLMAFGACDGGVAEPRALAFNLSTETWTEKGVPAVGESAESASAWDAESRKLYVQGSRNAMFVPRVFSAAEGTWMPLSPAGQPPTLWGSAAVWDNARQRFLVYGGRANQYHASIWAYDPATTRWAVFSESDIGGPGPRAQSTAVWISESKEMVVFGGRFEKADNSGLIEYNDLWAFSSTSETWRKLPASGAAPPRLSNASLVHPPGSDTILMFAGWNNLDVLVSAGLWSYSLTANTWTEVRAEGESPAARLFHTAVWDEKRSRMIVHGGYVPSGGIAGDVWAYNPASNSWTRLGSGPHFVADSVPTPVMAPAGTERTAPPSQPPTGLTQAPTPPSGVPSGPSRVSGTVRHTDGEAAVGVEVVACSATTPDPCPRTTSDFSGGFVIELPSGIYSVSFIPSGAPAPVLTVPIQTGIAQDVTLPVT